VTPETWAEIRRLFHVEKLSGRQIAERLNVHRETVYRALKHDHAPPPPARERSSVLDAFEKDIQEILEATPRMTAVRMLEELQRRGFSGGRKANKAVQCASG
jgi:transposase